MQQIDKFLNNITMYRLVVYVLSIYTALAVIFSFFGRIPSSSTSLVVSLGLLVASAYVVDRGFGRIFNVPTNMESSLITALILFLIVRPADSLSSGLVLLLAGTLASTSKFLLAWNGKHIFNPAAFSAAFINLTGLQIVTWWIGSSVFWPFTLVLGLAVVRKVRRFPLFLTFTAVAVAVQYLIFLQTGHQVGLDMKQALIASPLIFLSSIMLTEPATMPPRRNLQMIFGALVAVLYVEAWKLGPLIIYPEVALLVGNIFAYAVSPKLRVKLQLKEIRQISDRVYEYIFQSERRFNFLPGQYMEWTLASVSYDSRGNRRSFTVASSPTEPEVRLGVKFYNSASTFKTKLHGMKPGDIIYASQLAGNFTLENSINKKLAFIAGGIGITPFRSMVKYITDKNIKCDIVLLYEVADPKEFTFIQLFKEAERTGVKIVPIVTNTDYKAPGVVSAKVSAELLAQLVPDYNERTFYISGPNLMVDATKRYLHKLGVTNRRIKTDHFSGY